MAIASDSSPVAPRTAETYRNGRLSENADTGAQRAQTDDEADTKGHVTLNEGDVLCHFLSFRFLRLS